jgi:RNA polymerase sigma factor (sigma-70 family)
MRDDPAVMKLVAGAQQGDPEAWNGIVERYAPLVWSICVRYRLFGADADDIAASVWLRLVERLGSLRDPAALPGWLATTTRHECLRLLKVSTRQLPVDGQDLPDVAVGGSDEWLLTQERHIALRTAFGALSERCKALLAMLFGDPPAHYTEISAGLSIRVGGIGPTRQRCLDALRAHPSIVALGEGPGHRRGEAAT